MNKELFVMKIKDIEADAYDICDRLLSKPIIMLPAGRFYRLSIMALFSYDIKIEKLGDSTPLLSRGGDCWSYGGIDYIAEQTDELVNTYGNHGNYIITSRPFKEAIKNQLILSGVNEENIFSMPARLGDLVPASSFRRRYEVDRHFEEILEAEHLLSDEESQEQLWELLAIFCANTPVWREELPSEEYFNTPYIEIDDNETFVDAGMFDGATTRRFIEVCPGYKDVYGIEANPENMIKIQSKLEGYRNIHVFNNALCNTDIDLRFLRRNDGVGARLSEKGETIVKGIRGDDMEIAPTFIKFDIEGAEYDALRGFRNTIQKFKPKMAVSAYHSLQDHWRLIKVIKDVYPEYNLYLKHHYGYEDLYGTILYANTEGKQ